MISLVMRRGPTPGEVYFLSGDEITIGRGVKNQIVIHDNEVSREHCRLVRLDDDYELHDLASNNGTFLNGQRVASPRLLRRGAVIELGDSITLEYGVSDSQINIRPDFAERLIPNGQLPTFGDSDSSEDGVPARYSLMMLQGPAVGYVYNVEGDTLRIGRDLSNDIVVQDPEVSRFHVRLTRTKRGYVVEDQGSTNGAFINNLPLKEARTLVVGDILRLGSYVQLQFFKAEASAVPADSRILPQYVVAEDSSPDLFDPAEQIVDPALIARAGITPGELRDSIFVVYARDDWQTSVAPLLVSLQDAGLDVWVDQYLTYGSDDWRAAVQYALHETWLMILVASNRALASRSVRSMYRQFMRERKPLIPFVVDPTSVLPAELSRMRRITYEPINARRSYHKLIFEIMQFRRQRPRETAG
ncbi:MAG: FHA domain-containing protein [Anaerolineae bacterium]|nr:FHA domain-containing protein [Anaerolineae bacterium]NUQ07187.1 FHA domain-containing protein [Anaerolineae bacterium]